MAMQPKDHIDNMLVRKYADKQMNNIEDAELKALSTEKYWKLATELAQIQRTMVHVSTYMRKKRDDAANHLSNKGANPATT